MLQDAAALSDQQPLPREHLLPHGQPLSENAGGCLCPMNSHCPAEGLYPVNSHAMLQDAAALSDQQPLPREHLLPHGQPLSENARGCLCPMNGHCPAEGLYPVNSHCPADDNGGCLCPALGTFSALRTVQRS